MERPFFLLTQTHCRNLFFVFLVVPVVNLAEYVVEYTHYRTHLRQFLLSVPIFAQPF